MPTYVYECKTCAQTFEVEQRITEDPLSDCSCGANGTLKRLIQPISVVFNGPGFHVNDYSSAGTSAQTDSCSHPGPGGTCDGPCSQNRGS